MYDAFHTPESQDSQHPNAHEAKKSFVSPTLETLGVMHEVTRGPNAAGTEDAIIFAPGGDPTVDPS